MTVYIGLLRAVNLAGHKPVAMAALRDLMQRLDLEDGRTVLQSGNLVFRAAAPSAPQLEQKLATGAKRHLGLETEFFVRSAAEWNEMLRHNPFPKEAERDPSHLVTLALRDAPGAARVKALQAAIRDREVVRARGTHAYVYYPDGIGTSRLTIAIIERMLGTRVTGRNWNTVRKLAALAGQIAG